MPTREQVERAATEVEELRTQHHGRIVIDAVVPDYYARLSEALRRRLGPPLAQRHAVRQGAALPRRGVDPGLEFWNVREHSLADIWASFAGLQRLPRHRLAAGALRELRAARDRFRRLPLPGLRADRRRPGDRSGLPSVAASCAGDRACRGARGRGLRLSAHVSARRTVRLRAGADLSDTRLTHMKTSRAAHGSIPARWRATASAPGEECMINFNRRTGAADCSPAASRLLIAAAGVAQRAQPGFSPIDKTKPAKSGQDANLKPHPDAADRDAGRQAAARQDQAAGGLQGRGLVERPSRRPHHGDGRQGHDVHGHAGDRPRLCDHREGRQARGQDPAARA